MITKHYETKEEWLNDRIGHITGSKLADIISKTKGIGGKKKVGFYQLVADKLGLPNSGEDPRARGNRLEPEAIAKFEEETGLKVDRSLVMWARDDNDDIRFSPDGSIDAARAVEVKCLLGARHIEVLETQLIPDEYETQGIQAFIVNEKLETMYFVFYNPDLLFKPMFYIEMTRMQVQPLVDLYLEHQRRALEEVEAIVAKWSNF